MKEEKNRVIKHNGEIAAWKFLFCMMIFMYHFGVSEHGSDPKSFLFSSGFIAVEFFFIVSGYFMTRKALSMTNVRVCDGGTSNYLYEKIMKLFPFVTITYIVAMIFHFARNGFVLDDFLGSLPNLFFLSMTGIPFKWILGLGPIWYLSAMIVGMAIIFPLIRKYGRKIIVYVFPFIIVATYVYVIHEYGGLSNVYDYNFVFIRTGLLRGIAGLCAGAVAFLTAEWVAKRRFGIRLRFIVTVVEYLCLMVAFALATFSARGFDGVIILLLFFGIVLASSRQSMLLWFLNQKEIYFLERLSVPIYIFHVIIINIVNVLCGMNSSTYLRLCLSFIITCIFSVLVLTLFGLRSARYRI